MSLFNKCPHVWQVIKQEEQPSPVEIMRKTGVTKFTGSGWETWGELATRSVIVTRRCTKCNTEEVRRI